MCSRQPGSHCACADECFMSLPVATAFDFDVGVFFARLVKIVAKLMTLQAVTFIFLISVQCKYSDHKANGKLSNHRKHTCITCLYFCFVLRKLEFL